MLSSASLHTAPRACATPLAELSSLDHYLQPLQILLHDEQVTEVCINQPYRAWVERYDGWLEQALPDCTYDWCVALAHLVANHTQQRVSAQQPVLSATLPTGARAQIVLPPVAPAGCVSITLRKPATRLWSLDELAGGRSQAAGTEFGKSATSLPDLFRDTVVLPHPQALVTAVPPPRPVAEQELTQLLHQRDFRRFLLRAVQLRKNILLSGATGSGKTTLAKALILEVPANERLITIEDVRELVLHNQPNSVSLLYSQGGQGQAQITGADLLVSAKRMRPDRVFVSELRTGDEAYDYLVSINSGHPGSITSVHANSAEGAFVALAQLLKRSAAGHGMSTREGIELAQLHIDIVVQCARLQQRRSVSEIWYDPSTQRRGLV